MPDAATATPRPASGQGTALAGIALAALAVLIFAAITNQVWEDDWITFRRSRNLVECHELVYQPGERVHAFTSPLGVLIPATSYALTGSETGTLWAAGESDVRPRIDALEFLPGRGLRESDSVFWMFRRRTDN